MRTKPTLLSLAGVLALGGLTVWLPPRLAPTGNRGQAQEVLRQFVTLKDGRLHRVGAAVPFTGVLLEQYPDGRKQSRSEVVAGKLHGISEGWHTNGVLQVREHFVSGVSHGQRMRWDPQRRKISEAQIVDGRMEGMFRRWHDNGVLAEEVTMHRGELDGLSRAWYPSGSLKAEVTMAQGKAHAQHTYADGERLGPNELPDEQNLP